VTSRHLPPCLSALEGVARLIESREDTTGTHIDRIRAYSEAICRAMGVPGPEVELIGRASALHDIGKAKIADHILLKPGRLQDREFDLIRMHPEWGAGALKNAFESTSDIEKEFFFIAHAIVRHHHENWDGSGYPDRLKGESIPKAARIVALADAYDALTSWRCYQPASSHERATEIIRKASGRHFDPGVVRAFEAASGAISAIRTGAAVPH